MVHRVHLRALAQPFVGTYLGGKSADVAILIEWLSRRPRSSSTCSYPMLLDTTPTGRDNLPTQLSRLDHGGDQVRCRSLRATDAAFAHGVPRFT